MQTPLHLAVRADRVEVVCELLRAGARPGVVTHQGETSVHLAVRAGSQTCLAALLPHCKAADLDVCCDTGSLEYKIGFLSCNFWLKV